MQRRVLQLLQRRGLLDPRDTSQAPDAMAEAEPVLAGITAASVVGTNAVGPRARARLRRGGDLEAGLAAPPPSPRHARLEKFVLHANLVVPPRDRQLARRQLLLRPADGLGNWVLVSAASSGAGRGSERVGMPEARGEHPVLADTFSGAPFNCGRECTIVHKGQTLRIDRAYLASRAAPAPAVTLQLDGRQTSVVDSFSPNRELPATAQWNGDQLKITSSSACFRGTCTITQLVSIVATQLVVVTSNNTDGNEPLTFRYKKK